jgi:hypothetical protein
VSALVTVEDLPKIIEAFTSTKPGYQRREHIMSVLWETTYAIMANVSDASDSDEAFDAFDEAVGSPINRVADALEALLRRIEAGRQL